MMNRAQRRRAARQRPVSPQEWLAAIKAAYPNDPALHAVAAAIAEHATPDGRFAATDDEVAAWVLGEGS